MVGVVSMCCTCIGGECCILLFTGMKLAVVHRRRCTKSCQYAWGKGGVHVQGAREGVSNIEFLPHQKCAHLAYDLGNS